MSFCTAHNFCPRFNVPDHFYRTRTWTVDSCITCSSIRILTFIFLSHSVNFLIEQSTSQDSNQLCKHHSLHLVGQQQILSPSQSLPLVFCPKCYMAFILVSTFPCQFVSSYFPQVSIARLF